MSEFDYVIVGAGSAGCVLAARLTEDGSSSVLVLEAGGDDRDARIEWPIGYGLTFRDPRFNWMYEGEPDAALNGRRMYVPRGKVVGGSGAINAMVYIRGQAADFDDWAAAGNPGWSWRDVLPYFMKSEDHAGGATAQHGVGGPIHVADTHLDVHPLCADFIAACAALGIPGTSDFNAGTLEGAGLWPVTIKDGRRVSSASALLRPARRRPNLELRLEAHATRVLIEGEGATGVEYLRDGRACVARARREVILAAGAINSPQLLQLSGVGDPDLLRMLGISVVRALPAVGRGLQDHLAVSYFYRSRVPTLNNVLAPWWGKAWAGLRYLLTRRGPLSMSVNQAGAFVRGRPGLARPNLHLYFNPISYATTSGGTQPRLPSPDPFPAFLMSFNTCRPTSRGCVAIRSRDARDPPRIVTNYLATDADVADVCDGARLLRRLAAAMPLAGRIEREYLPGDGVTSDAAVLADFRERAASVYHASCTCAMGPDPARAVVDAALRVHGVGRLRVVDASVFPYVTSGNTNAPTIMVAERGADLIRAG